MAAEAGQLEQNRREARPAASAHVEALAAAGAALADADGLDDALTGIARAAVDALGASVAVARVREGGWLRAHAVVTASRALAATLEGSRLPAGDVAMEPVEQADALAPGLLPAVAAAAADAVLQLPVVARGELVGSLELMRGRHAFTPAERVLAGAIATHVGAAISAFRFAAERRERVEPERALELAGEALAAAAEEGGAAEEIVRLAVEGTAALACVLWRPGRDGAAEPLASYGSGGAPGSPTARASAEQAFDGTPAVAVDRVEEASGEPAFVMTLPLGRPAVWALQLFFAPGAEPTDKTRARLATFAVRALHALGAAERTRGLELELARTRALLSLAAEASEQLSLSHTLETAIERVAELLGAERIGVYLREDGGLGAAASRALAGPHTQVAQRLLELALGPFRGRGALVVEDAAADTRLAGLERELAATGIEAAVVVPLVVPGDVTGLLAVYLERGRALTGNEVALVTALAAQLAVSVQNARLHEQATELGAELEDVLALERQAARQLGALYEISRSFAQSLSLETTLDAVVRTIVELLDVDAAVIRMPDARREVLVPRALHVADVRMAEAVEAVLARPQPLEKLPGRRHFLSGRPLVLDAESAARLGPAHELLVPFLEKGSSAVDLPIATPAELLGTVSLLSLDPARPIGAETIEIGLSVAAQAALAIDNARLYQHQKEFADTMQRSLLPRSQPEVSGIEVGDVYESSARVDVGGDVYDFLTLDDGRLAVVLGDVTGHGIDAAADMAMAKFIFRSLAREHAEPGDFLAAANDIVCGEIAPGKFITMLYLTVDPVRGEIACAGAGHPRPRLVLPGGTVQVLDARGLALGIGSGQTYEEVRARLPVGASVVVYTDGVTEARRDAELYGTERLDRVLVERRAMRAKDLALAALADCRAFSRGDLVDDCALVVIRRTGD
jgi:serine phosphatase RsbU (regulator of sigma subunit)